jgi:Na+/H+ antiporter NhaB
MNRSLKSYITKDLGYVSKWWKYALITFLVIDAIVVTTLAGCYDGIGSVGEYYFDLGDYLLMIGLVK